MSLQGIVKVGFFVYMAVATFPSVSATYVLCGGSTDNDGLVTEGTVDISSMNLSSL